MYVCMCVFLSVCTYVYSCTSVCIPLSLSVCHVCVYVHVSVSIYFYLCVYIVCLHLWNYEVYSCRCSQAHNNIMFTCLHLSNYECVCVNAYIRIYTYAYIYIYAHVHPCMCACAHVWRHAYMYVRICVLLICIHVCTYIEGCRYAYIQIRRGLMASGRVDAGSQILKTLQSPNLGEGFPPLTPPTAPAQRVGGWLGKDDCFLLLLQVPANIQYLLFCCSSIIIIFINICYTSVRNGCLLFCNNPYIARTTKKTCLIPKCGSIKKRMRFSSKMTIQGRQVHLPKSHVRHLFSKHGWTHRFQNC